MFKSSTFEYNIIINAMQQVKTPKSVTYAKLGKGATKNKNSNAESTKIESNSKVARKSTGNLYEELMGQMQCTHNKYIRDLVARNQEDNGKNQITRDNKKSSKDIGREERKSLAQIAQNQCQQLSKKNEFKELLEREERLTIANSKNNWQKSYLSCQITPKNSELKNHFSKQFIPAQSNRYGQTPKQQSSRVSHSKQYIQSSFHKEEGSTFLGQIDLYLSSLKASQMSAQKLNSLDQSKYSTVKIRDQGYKFYELTSKLENSVNKIKEYKLKNHLLQKEQSKFVKKQKKMKENMYEMLDEIRYLNAQLIKQKKQRKKMEKLIQAFQLNIKKCKPERKKSMGRSTPNSFNSTLNNLRNANLRDFAQNLMHQQASSSSSQYDNREQIGLPRQEASKQFNSTQHWREKMLGTSKPKQNRKLSHEKYLRGKYISHDYDQQKIQHLFRSHQVSDESDQN